MFTSTSLGLGSLEVLDSDNVLCAFKVARAEFNVYEHAGWYWLSLHAETRPSSADVDPFLEINVPFATDPRSSLVAGKSFRVNSYHDQLFNLSSFYYASHLPFDGELAVEQARVEELVLLVAGEAEGITLSLRAAFTRNASRRRSFS